MLEQSEYVSFVNCGLPYHLSGEIVRRDALLLHTPATLAASLALDVRTGHRVTTVDRTAREVAVTGPDGSYRLPYDALLLAPGAIAVRPPIEGLDHPAVHTLRTVPDVDGLRAAVDSVLSGRYASEPASAVVIGAGFIGLEAVEALAARGLRAHLVELADHVLPPLDAELAPLLSDELETHGVDLHLGPGRKPSSRPTSRPSTGTRSGARSAPSPSHCPTARGWRPTSWSSTWASARRPRSPRRRGWSSAPAGQSASTPTSARPTRTSGRSATPSR